MEGSEPTVAQRTLQHRLADLPGSASTHVKMGFALSSKLEDNQLSDVVNYVASNFARRTRYDPDVASKISGIDRNIVGDLLSAVAITVGSVFDLDVSQEDFFTYIPENLLEEKDRDTVGKILTIALREKDSLKREFDQSKVANAVLPSFRLI